MNREEIVEQLTQITKRRKTLTKLLEKVDYDNLLESRTKSFLGKCFIKKYETDFESNYINCQFVYDIDKTNCTPISLHVNYFSDSDFHYEISQSHSNLHFRDDDDNDTWEEFSKEQFMNHYNKVNEMILKNLNN
jgi:hypothetical protein